MANTIKNIHKIAPFLTEQDVIKIEKGAALHLRHSNITFKIISVEDKTIKISVIQGKNQAEKYLTAKELIQRTKDLFAAFLPGYKLNVGPIIFTPNPISLIDSKWLNNKMLETGVRSKNLSQDTGIEKASISHWVNGTKPMSNIVRAMFYYYFLVKSQD